jgi:hypothetical protein
MAASPVQIGDHERSELSSSGSAGSAARPIEVQDRAGMSQRMAKDAARGRDQGALERIALTSSRW